MKLCQKKIIWKKRKLKRNLEANFFNVEFGILIQHRLDYEEKQPKIQELLTPGMFSIPENTSYFSLRMKSNGDGKDYIIKAKDAAKNTIDTFFYTL